MGKNKREFSLNAKNLASANLGQKIRFYRQIAGMTQKELGAACGVNESTIRNYELGNRYPDSYLRFRMLWRFLHTCLQLLILFQLQVLYNTYSVWKKLWI